MFTFTLAETARLVATALQRGIQRIPFQTDAIGFMQPAAALHVEIVQGQETEAVVGHELDGVQDVIGFDVVHRVMQADSAPARLDT